MATVTANRFLDTRHYYGDRHDLLIGGRRRHGWATPSSVTDRLLVVLIENGGIDLGLPDLVDRLVTEIPGASSIISDSMKTEVVSSLRAWLLRTTDNLIETAELALNRYTATKPATYGDVVVLRDSAATFAELKNTLFTASRSGKVVDLVILTHGSRDFISATDGIDGARIRSMATEFGGPLNLRSVYMMNCVGSSLNQAWLDVGARTSAGSHENNYLPEPTTYHFFSAWKSGQTFESAVTGAYRRTIDDINAVLRGIVIGLAPLPGALLADQIDVSGLSFVVASRPEVVGAGGLTVASDTLPPAATRASTGQSLVVTVVPPGARAFSSAVAPTRTLSPSGRTFLGRWEPPGPQLDQRILAAERFVTDRVAVALTQPQIDALLSFAIGIGGAALQRSTLLTLLDAGDLGSVPAEMRKWTKLRRGTQVV